MSVATDKSLFWNSIQETESSPIQTRILGLLSKGSSTDFEIATRLGVSRIQIRMEALKMSQEQLLSVSHEGEFMVMTLTSVGARQVH